MTANPVLARLRRGALVENRHRGAFCVVDARDRVVAGAGDIDRPVFPRSAIKPLQALPLLTTGAARQFGLDDKALALACASHHGEEAHVEIVSAMLARAGLSEADLECGAHPPTNARARKALAAAGGSPSTLHNNCSGKHAGMLLVARAQGAPTRDYVSPRHRVQIEVRAAIEAVLGVRLSEDRCGTDGCSIPTFAAPLRAFASGFARFATGEGLDAPTAEAAARLWDAATAHPHLLAGTDAFDSGAVAALKGRVLVKIGAEGVFCGAVRDRGLGFALKCDDGNMAAATAMVAALLSAVAGPDPEAAAFLARHADKELSNWRGLPVARLQAVRELF